MKKLSIILFLITSIHSYAFKLSPMSHSILGGGSKSNIANFTVSNDSDVPIAVQLEVKVRKMLINGKEDMPDTDDFLIFPDQLVLAPNSRRVVKVRWLKGEVKDVEKSFRLIAEQLPIDMNTKKVQKTNIKILLRYIASLYVTPKEVKPELKTVSVNATKDLKKVHFVVENIGNTHLILSKPKIVVTQEGKDFLVKGYEGILGENVLAKTKREFFFSPPSLVNIQKPFTIKVLNEK